MIYYNEKETKDRISRFATLLKEKSLDYGLVYYDELNIANGWYLTSWCPQFESGAVLVGADGSAMLLGGPESEPFAKQSSAIKETRNFTVFMVPDEEYPNAVITGFDELNAELSKKGAVKAVGIVGMEQIPYGLYRQLSECFKGVKLVDITEDYVKFRHDKSAWEIEQIRSAFLLCDEAYSAMKNTIKPGIAEYEVAAAGEAVCRKKGATSFAFKTIVGSGIRANAVVPTATNKIMEAGEMVMLGISPRINGYAGVFGHTLPVSGKYSPSQLKCLKDMVDVMESTRSMLRPGVSGREIDAKSRIIYKDRNYLKYMVCPFAHTIGLMEAEAPFFGPNSNDVLREGMCVCVDVSFFGHPEFNGLRVETGYLITKDGCEPFAPKMEAEFFNVLKNM